MVNGKFFCHLTILLMSFSFMAVKCNLEPTDQFIDSPTDTKQGDALILHKRPSFYVGSRYGRSGSSSPGSSLFATSKTRRLNVVPRNDRFFLSSRYGKRAEISTGTQLSSKPIPQQQQQYNDDFDRSHVLPKQTSSSSQSSSLSSDIPPYAYMSCIYTGLQNYYRCNSIYSVLYFKKPAISANDDENEALSTYTTGAALLGNDHDDDSDGDNIDNDNDVDEHDKK